jgi:hypothetical protein
MAGFSDRKWLGIIRHGSGDEGKNRAAAQETPQIRRPKSRFVR